MAIKYPLRQKTIILFVGFTLLLGVLFTGVSFVIAYVIEDEVIESLLIQEIAYLQQADAGELRPRFSYFSVHQNIDTMPASVEATLQQSPKAQEIFTSDQFHYHIRPFLLDGKAYYLLAEVSALLTVSQHSGQITLLMLYLSLFAIVMAGWFAFKIANYTSRPLVKLTDELAHYRKTHEQIKLSATSQNNEVGYLATAIENSMNELSRALLRESEFTRDVSHELRTPLTVINNMLQLAQHRGWQEGDTAEMQQQLQMMQQVVDVLLALARQQHSGAKTLTLLPIVEEAVLEQQHLLGVADIEAQIHLSETLEVLGEPQLIKLLLKVLLENSVRHGTKGCVVFRAINQQLLIENQYDAAHPIAHGIGLHLAEKLANCMGWQMQSHTSAKHFVISITLK